jgi:hypothetical protein
LNRREREAHGLFDKSLLKMRKIKLLPLPGKDEEAIQYLHLYLILDPFIMRCYDGIAVGELASIVADQLMRSVSEHSGHALDNECNICRTTFGEEDAGDCKSLSL